VRGRITGRGLFVDVRGAVGDPPLLFLHGGPGQGAYEFMAVQGEYLGRMVRLVGLDQRGVGRSAPLPHGAPLTVADLVDDCEEVRRVLGIERWAVLGQSFGGALALRYVTSHPGSIAAVVFENPPWDMELSFRATLPRVAAMLAERGRDREARAALAAVERERSPQGLLSAYRTALDSLGKDREVYFVPDQQTRARLREVRIARTCLGDDGEKFDDESSERHLQAITADRASYDSLLPLLGRLPAPALLITGGQDPLTSAEQRQAFRQASPRNQVREFQRAGHCVHADEPYAYASTVAEFIRANWPTARRSR
jgi:proline iminopeptidase